MGPSSILSIDRKPTIVFLKISKLNTPGCIFLNIKMRLEIFFIKFHPLVEKFFKTKILSLYIDGGGEYKSLDPFLTLMEYNT